MLHYLSDTQAKVLEHNPEYLRRGHECPVCQNDGVYWYEGEEHVCPDNDYGHEGLQLAKLYWLSFIPTQYHSLLWDEFPYDDLKPDIDRYLTNFKFQRLEGLGYTFWSEELGTGKTWAATHILRELVKQDYDGYFASFLGMPGYYDLDNHEEREFRIKRIREAEILVLDDVKAPFSVAQRNFFEEKLEQLLRERTSANFPTIVTSNLTPQAFETHYPRCYSLLAAKNQEIELNGDDARLKLWKSSRELAEKGERRPIT